MITNKNLGLISKIGLKIGLATMYLNPFAHGEEAKEVKPGYWYNPNKDIVDVYRNENEYVLTLLKRFATKEQRFKESQGYLKGDEHDGIMFYLVSFLGGVVLPSFLSDPEKYDTHERKDTKVYHSLEEALKSNEFKRLIIDHAGEIGMPYVVAISGDDQVKLYNSNSEWIADLQGSNFIWVEDRHAFRNEMLRNMLSEKLKKLKERSEGDKYLEEHRKAQEEMGKSHPNSGLRVK